jgi:drug/metabolite transporter (DMT)-like permease
MLGIGLALASAGIWGFGDFAGGLAVRRNQPFVVLVLSTLSGIVLLSIALIWIPEAWPAKASVLWALAAGSTGALGITSLYTGLARGRAAVVAPTTAVVGAVIPVIFGLITKGLVAPPQLMGMAIALAGLWLVSASTADSGQGPSGLGYGLMGGLGVSGFFICIAQVESGSLLLPLVIARLGGLAVGVVILAVSRGARPRLRGQLWALSAGAFDTGGNLLYVLAIQHLRIDLAAVLASLYPAVTVLLAMRFLHQHVAGRQWFGVGLCLAGVGLISL